MTDQPVNLHNFVLQNLRFEQNRIEKNIYITFMMYKTRYIIQNKETIHTM